VTKPFAEEQGQGKQGQGQEQEQGEQGQGQEQEQENDPLFQEAVEADYAEVAQEVIKERTLLLHLSVGG
jgi:hypothetical protein